MRLFSRASLFLLFLIYPLSSAVARETQYKPTGRKALIPDISLVGAIVGGWFRDDPPTAVDQGENPERTGFNLQSGELAVQSIIDPYLRGDIFLLFKEDAVEIEEAVLTTLSLPWNLQMRAGKLLGRLGRQNTQHVEQLDFVDQSFTNRYFFGPEGFSEMGAELSLLLPASWFSEVSFEFLQGENGGNFDGARKGDFAYLGHWKNGFDLTDNLAGQIGLSGVLGYNNTAIGNLTEIAGSDLYLRWRPSPNRGLKWQTEYFFRRREIVGGTETEGGLYSQLIFQVTRRWETGVRGERIGWPNEGFRQTSLSPQLTFSATEFMRLRTQYNWLHQDGVAREQHQAFLQLIFNMGPHGAHQF